MKLPDRDMNYLKFKNYISNSLRDIYKNSPQKNIETSSNSGGKPYTVRQLLASSTAQCQLDNDEIADG